ncbi:MAG TPA: DUF2199 domain-containing protein [Allosphingosinicella sp.]
MPLFGRRKGSSALEALKGASWRCAGCELDHAGMFDLAAFAPDHWEGPREYEPNSALRLDGDFLSEDFCVIAGEHFFVRCVYLIPVHGLESPFGFGIWSSLSRRNLEIYVDGFDDGDFADWGPWSSWFANELKLFSGTRNQLCWMNPREERQRPCLSLDNPDHPLAIAQRDGITAERVLEIYAAYGHLRQPPPAS